MVPIMVIERQQATGFHARGMMIVQKDRVSVPIQRPPTF